jgi:hypothetical protein
MFDIYLTTHAVPETAAGVDAVYGKIWIETYNETFISSLVTWDQAAYQHSWQLAMSRIIEGAEKSALITSYVEPHKSKYLIWWPLYRRDETIYVQNQMLFYDQLEKPFSLEQSWEFIKKRQTVNAEGNQVSEWTTNVSSLRECLAPAQSVGSTGTPIWAWRASSSRLISLENRGQTDTQSVTVEQSGQQSACGACFPLLAFGSQSRAPASSCSRSDLQKSLWSIPMTIPVSRLRRDYWC